MRSTSTGGRSTGAACRPSPASTSSACRGCRAADRASSGASGTTPGTWPTTSRRSGTTWPTAERGGRLMPIALMLATLTDRRDFDEDWLLERKFDGERCVAWRDGDTVRLESRTGKDLTATYPDVRSALEAQRLDRFMVDGEVVVFDGDQTSFSRLQQRLGTTRPSPALVEAHPAVYCVF